MDEHSVPTLAMDEFRLDSSFHTHLDIYLYLGSENKIILCGRFAHRVVVNIMYETREKEHFINGKRVI